MGCWSSSKAEKSKRWVAGVPARLKNQKDGHREIPQGQKIKKMGIGKFRKAKKSKRWASGNSASPNQVKTRRRKIPEPKKSKNRASGNSARPNRVKMARRKIPQPRKIKKTGVGKFRKIEKFYLHIDFLSWRQNANRLTLQTKKIKT